MNLTYVLIFGFVLLGVVYVVTCYVFAQLTLNPKRQPVIASPADYGLVYEDIEFHSLDHLCLKGWFISGNPRKVLLVTHPMFCNRSSTCKEGLIPGQSYQTFRASMKRH